MTTPEILPLRGTALPVRTFQSSAEAAAWHTAVGIWTVPVVHRGKNPIGTDWEKQRIDAANLPAYYNGQPQNVGGLLGISRLGTAGLTDVDLDSCEALRLAPAFLPDTSMSFGRASKPASHRCYFTDPAVRLEQFRDPLNKKSMLVELRGLKKTDGKAGLQTVLPGSVHTSGEQITFEPGHDSAPTTIPPAELISAVHKVAAGALLCRYWPAEGRHETMLSLAGALARAQWPRAEALTFCHCAYQALSTHDPDALARVDAEVNDSYDKVAAGEPATGFPKLIEHIDPKVVKTAFEWLGIDAPGGVRTGAGDDWRAEFIKSETGTIKPLLANVLLVLRNDPKYQGLVAYDEFSGDIVLQRPAAWLSGGFVGLPWNDICDSLLAAELQKEGLTLQTRIAAEGLNANAHEHGFHPVRDYLRSCRWDGTARLASWLPTYLGTEVNSYTAAVGRCWLISGVARIMRPGVKADSVLGLIGQQGILKSTALEVLASEPWFTDHISPLGEKDSRLDLQGTWIVELAELDRVRGADLARVKNFLSTKTDKYRVPYGHRKQPFPRSCIFASSSNIGDMLTDETGNRRWWPVNCGRINIEALRRDRDQIWGEALALFEAGEKWWLAPELVRAAAFEADKHYQPGIWDEEILSWCERPVARQKRIEDRTPGDDLPFDSQPYQVTLNDVLVHCIGKSLDKLVFGDQMQIQRCLIHASYKKQPQCRVNGHHVRYYKLFPPAGGEQ